MDVINWFSANWTTIVAIITQVIGVASIIVKLTPSKVDDGIVDNVIAFVSRYIALNKEVK